MTLLLMLWCSFALAQPHTSIELSGIESVQVLPRHLHYVDEKISQTSADILHLPDLDWQNLNRNTLNSGDREHPVWLRFDVSNAGSDTLHRLLDLRALQLDEVDFYQTRSDGSLTHFSAGLRAPKLELYRNSTHFIFPIALAAGEHSTLYLRIRSDQGFQIPLFIVSEQRYEHNQQLDYLFLAAMFGVLAALLIFSVIYYGLTRATSFAWLGSQVLAVAIYLVSASGIGYQRIWGDLLWWRLHGHELALTLLCLGSTLFLRHALDLKRHGGWVLHANTALTLYWLITLLLTPTGIVPTAISESAALASSLLALGSAIFLWLEDAVWHKADLRHGGERTARNGALAWAVLNLFIAVHVMMLKGYLPANFLTENAILMGLIVQLLWLAFALAERQHRALVEREKTQAKSLETQRLVNRERETRLQAQETLLERQTESQLQLEQRLSERTEALVRALKDLKTANQELSRLSTTDSLTRLHNRRYFDELLAKEFERAKHHHYPVAMILIDIDHFRQFNEAHGHLVGDDCLRLVAASLQDVVTRKTDLVARFGGDEFAVVLLETREEDAVQVAERLRKHINDIKFINRGQKLTISASLGVAGMQPAGGDQVTSLINAAEQAIHLAKNEGRNRSMRANPPISNQTA